MVTALAAARADRSAVLAISGEVPTDREGRGGFQDASARRSTTSRCCGPLRPKRRCHLAETPRRELRTVALTALRERSPVHLWFLDVQRAELDASWVPLPEAAYPRCFSIPRRSGVVAVFDGSAGKSAKNIVMLAGIGVGHAHGGAALAAAAERFAIPVATTLGAKGILPENHPLSLGVFGYGGSRWATEAVLDPAVEVLIVLGSALSQRDTLQWNRKCSPHASSFRSTPIRA